VQRDRLRAIALALDGEMTKDIEAKLGRSKAFVQKWVYAYREKGLEAIKPGKAPGARPKLTPEQTREFRQRVLDGPRAEDGVCTLRGLDFQRILREEFGVEYSLNGVYQLLHRLGFSSLAPRPKHRKTDFEVQEQFKVDTPLLWMSSDGKHKVYVYRSGSRTSSAPASKAP
jgi:transposase